MQIRRGSRFASAPRATVDCLGKVRWKRIARTMGHDRRRERKAEGQSQSRDLHDSPKASNNLVALAVKESLQCRWECSSTCWTGERFVTSNSRIDNDIRSLYESLCKASATRGALAIRATRALCFDWPTRRFIILCALLLKNLWHRKLLATRIKSLTKKDRRDCRDCEERWKSVFRGNVHS